MTQPLIICIAAHDSLAQGNSSGRGVLTQIAPATQRMLSALETYGVCNDDLVKLVLFYRPSCSVSRSDILQALNRALGPGPPMTLTLQPIRQLPHASGDVLLDAYAMPGTANDLLNRHSVNVVSSTSLGARFCDGLRAGDLAFVSGQLATDAAGRALDVGDLVSQNAEVLRRIATVLAALDLEPADIVKINTWRSPPPSHDSYQQAAEARFHFLRQASPAVTGITVPGLDPKDCLIQVDAWAATGAARDAVRRVTPPGHWDWSLPTPYSQGLRCGDLLFVGGQAALDGYGNVLDAGDLAAQTDTTLNYIDHLLRAAGASWQGVLKLTTYYCSNTPMQALDVIHAQCAKRLGSCQPAFSAVVVDELAYPGQCVEIEALSTTAT